MKRLIALLVLGSVGLFGQNPVTAVYPGAVMDDEDYPNPTNFTSTTLSAGISAVDTAIPVVSAAGMLFPTIIVIDSEVIKVCTESPANTLNVCTGGRGLLSTAAVHSLGATVGVRAVDYYHLRAQAELVAIQTALGPAWRMFTRPTGPTAQPATTPLALTPTARCSPVL